MYYTLSIGLKTKIDFGLGFAPNLTGLAYTAPPDLLDGGQEVSYPPQERKPASALRDSLAVATLCFLTFDYLPPPCVL